jgi:hypothetical protein
VQRLLTAARPLRLVVKSPSEPGRLVDPRAKAVARR